MKKMKDVPRERGGHDSRRIHETPLERFLSTLAIIQSRNHRIIFLMVLAATLFLSYGALNLSLETDMVKLLPQDVSGVVVEQQVRDVFGSSDVIFLLAKIDRECVFSDAPTDIRDPRVIRSIMSVASTLEKESNVMGVSSIADPFRHTLLPSDQNTINSIIRENGLESYVSGDYSSTIITVRMDIGGEEENVRRGIDRIREIVSNVEKPPCLRYSITGNPPMRYVLLNLMIEDMKLTVSVAAFIIFIVLLILRRSFSQALIIFTPLIIGLLWTAGILGILNIKINMATIGLGAMILGLGVEYGVFMVDRYNEERKKGNTPQDSVKVVVPSVGSGIAGSGTTTMAGFLALATVAFPMLRSLGISLAIGIFCMILVTIIFVPVLLMMRDETFIFLGGKDEKR